MSISRVASTLAGAGLLILCLSPSALAGTATSGSDGNSHCGFYLKEDTKKVITDAYYNHCAYDGAYDGASTLIEVKMGKTNYFKCVYPGKNWLGRVNYYGDSILEAWPTGQDCPSSGIREAGTAFKHPGLQDSRRASADNLDDSTSSGHRESLQEPPARTKAPHKARHSGNGRQP
ncbi:DUF6355 family natural product biosynthesis protein [Streptomyces sp. UNOC14_S4]|uniref:DUF6355 family natural product biosynthesis protein n=1 Tax=Streptomyces sp. UNOC14_S4 TaxID=2872340 RepID=UPI001E3D3367|nr:DUF6355 family natural product biosynthesis protein [Streptomyces sp. UNOC14_S4]MCC3769109.1 hypothetical protein [Streptomyces sp. UNOC14_S4]